MEQSPSYKRKIQIQFQAYCYKILRGEAFVYYRYENYLQMNTDQMIICLKYWNMT